jgi:hypothetical protein
MTKNGVKNMKVDAVRNLNVVHNYNFGAKEKTDKEGRISSHRDSSIMTKVPVIVLLAMNPATLSSIVVDKKILTWEAGQELPAEKEGFSLFIRPQEPVKINNGSYIVIDYVNFALESSFTVYYNIYRDEFFAEARIWNIPDVSYEFDASDLEELEEKLRSRMTARLQQVRKWAEEQARKEQEKA